MADYNPAVALPTTMRRTQFTPEQQAMMQEQPANIPMTSSRVNPSGQMIGPVLSKTADQTMADMVTYGAPGVGIGLLDTLGQSLGVFGDDTVMNTLNNLSPNGLGDFYARNKTALRTTGEVAGIFLPGMAAMKALKSIRYAREAGYMGEAVSKSNMIDKLLGSSARLTALETKVANAAKASTSKFGVFAGRTFANDPALLAAKQSFYTGKVAEAARQTAAFESSYRLLYNDSELMYPADYTLSDQLKWGAVGFGATAAVDLVVGRYAVRKLIQQAWKDAPDLGQFSGRADELLFRPGARGTGVTQAAATKSEITLRQKSAPDPKLATNLNTDQTILDNIIATQLQGMAKDLHPVISKTELAPEQIRLGMQALQKDETTFLYTTKLGHVPEDKAGFYEEVKSVREKAHKAVEKANIEFSSLGTKANAPQAVKDKTLGDLRSAAKSAELASEEMHYVIENDGAWSVFGTRANNFLDRRSFGDITYKRYRDTSLVDTKLEPVSRRVYQATGFDFKMHDNFVVESTKFDRPDEMSAMFATASKFIKEYKPVEGQKFPLNEKLPWFQIEATLELAKKNPEVAQNIVYGGKLTNQSDAMFEVLDQKYQKFLTLMERTEAKGGVMQGTPLENLGKHTPEEIGMMLNLPRPEGMQAHPLVQVFAQGKMQRHKNLYDMFLPEARDLTTPNRGLDMLQQAMRETMEQADATKQYAFSGTLFQQNDVRPVFVAAKSIPTLTRSDAVLHSLIEANRENVLAKLGSLDAQSAPLVSKVVSSTINLASVNAARDVQSLADGVVSGRGILTAQDRIAMQEPALKAAMLVSQNSEKMIETHLSNVQKTGIFDQAKLPEQVGRIFQQKNKPIMIDANRGIHSYRFGWDVNRSFPNGDGSVSYVLNKDSAINQRLMETYFPDAEIDMTGDIFMPDMSVAARANGFTPLKIHAEAGTLLDTISELSKQSGRENNAVKYAMGLPSIKIRDFHLPTPELGMEGTWFVKNSADKVVATYSGPNSSANRRLAEEAVRNLGADGDVHLAISLDDVRRQHNIFDDDAFFNLIDYTDQLAKTGKGITGGLAKTQIDTSQETLKAMLNSLAAQYMNVGTRARALIFEPELNYATQAAQAAGLSSHFKELNIYDRYKSLIYGTTPQSRNGAVTKLYNSVENLFDGALSYAYAHSAELAAGKDGDKTHARNLKNLVSKSTSENIYKQYQQQMEKWSPFEDTLAFAESTYRQEIPKDMRSVMAGLARVSSTMSLRFLDAGTAVLNMASLMTNAPGVMAALRPMAGESKAAHAARTASWGLEWTEGIRTFSSMKAMNNTSKALFSGELAGPMAEAAKRGMFEPEYAALARLFNSNVKGVKKNWQQHLEWTTKLADSSETMSRMMSWAMGYKIGKDLAKFEDEGNLFIFANNFANDMIGNYSPKNKPIMFQGALGLPLGAFQTYMFNYYRRMFDYIERKDVRALTAAYAAQASVFGAKSVPGFGLFNDYALKNQYTGDDFDSRVQRNLPENAYELLMHGSLSSVPAIFGDGGLAFYTRGSVDMTQLPPTPMDLQKSPPFQFLTNTAEGIRRTISNVFSSQGFSLQHQEEILANFSTNRAIKNVMEMAANAKVDRQGNVVDLGTRDAINYATLVLGSQPTRVQNLVEAYSSQRQVEMNQSALRARLNDHTRAMMRGGEFDLEALQGAIESYRKSGGNPAYLGEWLRNTMQTSVTPKSHKKLKELLGSKRGIEFMNMLTAMQQH